MGRFREYLFLWGLGGTLYYTFEVIFRGFSHWSMYILGGICFLFIFIQGKSVHWADSIQIQLIRCIIFVTAMEFITGIIVNKWLNYSVWDYSEMPLQLFGQICVPFIFIFSILCFLGILLSGYVGYYLFHEEKPRFHF